MKLLVHFSVDDSRESDGNPQNNPADPVIPVDSETISNTDNTNKGICTTLERCYSQNSLTDALTINNLLPKLNSKDVAAVFCMSSIDRTGFPFKKNI